MNAWGIMRMVAQLAKNSYWNPQNQNLKDQTLLVLDQLARCGQFVKKMKTNNQICKQVKNMSLICELVCNNVVLVVLTVLLSLCGIGIAISQPYLNDYLKSKIANKFEDNLSIFTFQIVSVYILFKLVSSITYVVLDLTLMILGVRLHSSTTYKLLKVSTTSAQITCIEDDCQRLQNIPPSSTNSITKIIQFTTFSTIIISKLPTHQAPIALTYWIFFTFSIFLAFRTSRLNIKMMEFKQNRIKFQMGENNVMQQRQKQIKIVKHLMIIDGIGLMLPWLLNIGLMIVIYSLENIPTQDRYFLLTVFGLLRVSISGFGINLNYFAQSWSSATRVSSHIYQHSNKSLLQVDIYNYQQKNDITNQNLGRHQSSLQDLVKVCQKTTPYVLPCLLLLFFLNFTSHFMYGYCAKSLISGGSILQNFNILTLTLQLVSPIALYSYICYINQNLSKSIYKTLFLNNKNNINEQLSAQKLNRLVGDIRLLDRQLYFATYGTISHLTSIGSSVLYCIVILNNKLSSIVLIFIILCIILVSYLCDCFINVRKQCYQKQAINKGKLLQYIITNKNGIKKWRRIYTLKYFGFFIQATFITILYTVIILITSIIITVVMISNANVEQSSILVLLISQLDLQFLVLFVQVVLLQTTATAVIRCFHAVKYVPILTEFIH